MKKTIASIFCLLMMTTSLAGCLGGDDGDSGTDTVPDEPELSDWDVYYVTSGDDLPNCNSDSFGRLYYVEDVAAFEVCNSTGWVFIDISGADGQAGANGTNGIDGMDGVDGQDGQDGTDGQDVNQTYVDEMVARIATLEWDLLNATTCQLGPWANCQGANLTGMNLSGMDLTGIDLRGALIAHADLSNATLTHADLSSAIILNSEMNNTNFQFATMRSITISNSYGKWSYFQGADMLGADLSSSILTNSYWNHADLSNAYLFATNMSSGFFDHTDLAKTQMYGTNMSNTVIQWSNLGDSWTGYAYFYTVYWSHTICPDGTNSEDSANSGSCSTW